MKDIIARQVTSRPERKNAGGAPSVEQNDLGDQLKTTFESLKSFNERLETEKKQLGEATAETKAALEKTQVRMDELEVKLQRANLASVETKDGGDETKTQKAQTSAFHSYVRKGAEHLNDAERKSLATDDLTTGGALLPAPVLGRFIEKLIQFSNLRKLCTVETISTGDAYAYPGEGAQNFDADWIGQRGDRPETDAGKVRLEKIPVHEIYAKPLITQTQLDDTSFDVEGWSHRRVARRFAVIEGQAYLSGDGVNKPEGMLTHADIEYVPSGAASTITMDGMFDLMADLPTEYALLATIIGNRGTKYALRKLKDVTSGQYLWQPSPQLGVPAAFDNTPFEEVPDMPAIGANTYPILYGDFKAAYTIVDRQMIRFLRDPYSSKPFIEMYSTMRVGGQVVLAEALRKLKIATS